MVSLNQFSQSCWETGVPSEIHNAQSKTEELQEPIYQFFIEQVRREKPDIVLRLFETIFINFSPDLHPEFEPFFNYLIVNDREDEFRALLKRTCYILINNWCVSRDSKFVQKLIQAIDEVGESDSLDDCDPDPDRLRLHGWLVNFSQSPEFLDIRNLMTEKSEKPWSDRYQTYLLVSQYANPENSWEHREVARNLSQKLKDRYKFELAMYLARSESPTYDSQNLKNPTRLGKGVITLIKQTVSTQRISIYKSRAEQFLKESNNLTGAQFTKQLYKYLTGGFNSRHPFDVIQFRLEKMLSQPNKNWHDHPINSHSILKLCNQIIEFFTVEPDHTPSFNFRLLIDQKNYLSLAIVLLKIILICRNSQAHLELCIAHLIRFYQDADETECQPFMQFIEVFHLVSTIFTENIQYHLVRFPGDAKTSRAATPAETYRLFCQFKGADLRHTNLRGIDPTSLDLRGADLRATDLAGINLIQLDLHLANFADANLTRAVLNGSKLPVVNFKGANLQEASLVGADLRRADLERADLTRASLTSARLQRANLRSVCAIAANLMAASLDACDLQGADFSEANLQGVRLVGANLAHANLRGANLRSADLQQAHLEGAHLEGADLRGANLRGAHLKGANLHRANFYRADLRECNLTGANLRRVNLNRSHLQGAELMGANLHSCRLRGADLTRANLKSADLTGSDLTRANLSHANCRHANLSSTFIRHANLTGADFSRANLEQANLFGSNIEDAKLTKGGNRESGVGIRESGMGK
ncbi:MAG: pentapeptide repeat-containing protein [Limnospira sp.]